VRLAQLDILKTTNWERMCKKKKKKMMQNDLSFPVDQRSLEFAGGLNNVADGL